VTAPTFVSNRLAELPAELNGPQGQAWATGMGTVQDAQMDLLRVAAKARLPFLCPDDALDAVGAWMLLPRFPGEPNGTAPTQPGLADGTGYRGRLCVAWTTWKIAGTKQAIISSLNAWGLPDVTIYNDYETAPTPPPPWPGSWYTRFAVKIGPSFGGFGWGTGNDPTPDQQTQMRRQVLQWKWLYSYPVDITIDDGMGYVFTFYVGPLIDYGLVIDESTMGGFNT